MLGRGQADMVQIEAHRAHQVVGKLRLLLLGKMAVQHRIVDLRLFFDFFQERHDVRSVAKNSSHCAIVSPSSYSLSQ